MQRHGAHAGKPEGWPAELSHSVGGGKYIVNWGQVLGRGGFGHVFSGTNTRASASGPRTCFPPRRYMSQDRTACCREDPEDGFQLQQFVAGMSRILCAERLR